MRILVLGGGLAGVTAAFYLARDGHQVSVLERHPEAASETSFANAGLLAPGHAYAWASPKAPGILLRSLFREDQAFRLRLGALPGMIGWGLKFLAQCTEARARANTVRKASLCRYAMECLHEVVAETGVEYDALARGNLYLYRSAKSFAAGVEHMGILRELGLELNVLEGEAITAVDPALGPALERIAGAVHAPADESGDPCTFTRELARWLAEERGVELRFGVELHALEATAGRIERVHTSAGALEAEAYVLALGCDSARLARPLGVRLPIYPVKGYSVTLPARAGAAVPALGGVDEDNLVAYCPLGERLRFTSTAEFAGYDRGWRESDFRAMLRAARELFPEAADYGQPSYWSCLRPMTPDGPPILGKSPVDNLYLCTGHGHMGWTWACGTGRILADVVAGRDPGIDLEGMTYR